MYEWREFLIKGRKKHSRNPLPPAPASGAGVRAIRVEDLIIILTLVLFIAAPALAQDNPPTDDDVNRVAKGLYCPVCENVPLDVCPTLACVQWRETIRQKLAEGWTDEQIRDYFAQQYGDRVLAAPPARGLNWLVYILPPLGLLAGALIVFRVLRSGRQLGQEPAGALTGESPPILDERYAARLEAELAKRK